MKVLFVVNGSEFGGATRHVLALSRHLLESDNKVGIVSAPEPRLMREAASLGAQVFPNPYFVRPIRLHNDLRALGPVYRAIKQFQPDLVSAHSTKAGFAARILCALLGFKPVLFTAHGWAFTEGRGSRARSWLARAERLAAKVTTQIVCVSEHDRELAVRLKVSRPEKLVMIHNGVDPAPFLAARGNHIRSEFCLGEVSVITFVGRLASPKDPLAMLQACRMLEGDFRVLLVGDGELRSSAEEFARRSGLGSKVIFTGERKDIPEILAASDIFLLSSRWEGLPLTIIEAMMTGLPLVATRVGGIPELVEDGVTGYLVPPQDPSAIAFAVQKLLVNSQLCSSMGARGRERALEHFTVDQMLRRTETVYVDALKHRRESRESRQAQVKHRPNGRGMAKRTLDIMLSTAGLIGSLPFWGLIALAIKLEDGGPVFYRQRRVGLEGREFDVMKFRSMVIGAENKTGPVWAREKDNRVTRVGRFLRAMAMDELPQLWNIFRGQMSFVGPRAERPALVEEFRRQILGYDRRHLVIPGLTGVAQVYGRYDTPPKHKLRYDVFYLNRKSLWLDIRLIGLSFLVTFTRKWEIRQKKLPRWLAHGPGTGRVRPAPTPSISDYL